jgi:urocanate hydratase
VDEFDRQSRLFGAWQRISAQDLTGHLVVFNGWREEATAAAMAGAAVLVLEPDIVIVKDALRRAYCDYLVNRLDEAVRLLRQSVRRRHDIVVGLVADPETMRAEMARRGIVAHVFAESPAPTAHVVAWRADFARLDALALTLFPDNRLLCQWVERAQKRFRRPAVRIAPMTSIEFARFRETAGSQAIWYNGPCEPAMDDPASD